jgi:NAD-dependent SIR2 family protein deacetylase
MHGSIHDLVCPACGVVTAVTAALLRRIRAKQPLPCACAEACLRMRVMLYDDGEGGRFSCAPVSAREPIEKGCMLCAHSCIAA